MLDGMSPRTTAEWHQMNEPVIAEFRSRGGQVSRRWPVLLLTTTGAKTGKQRVTPLNFSIDGDRHRGHRLQGRRARHPSWYLNLVANPEVTIELGRETFPAHATTVEEPERTRLYDQQAAEMTFFDGYRKRVTTRQIPVVVFEAPPGVVRQALTRSLSPGASPPDHPWQGSRPSASFACRT